MSMYQKKRRVIFDIKVSILRVKLRREKGFLLFLEPASKMETAALQVLPCALLIMFYRCSLTTKQASNSRYNVST